MPRRTPARRSRARRPRPKLNCWEFTACGREPGGARAAERGSCPAATDRRADGMHGGRNGGRVCWTIAGTLCEGKVRGSRASKIDTCLNCEFCLLVLREESGNSCPERPAGD